MKRILFALLILSPFVVIAVYLLADTGNRINSVSNPEDQENKLQEIKQDERITILPNSKLKYTSPQEKLSFIFPSDWVPSTDYKPESNDPMGDALGIQDPNGKVQVIWISLISGLGGGCDPDLPFDQPARNAGSPCALYEVVDVQKLPAADLYYVAYVVTRDGVNYYSFFAIQDKDGALSTRRDMGYRNFVGKNNGGASAELAGRSILTTGTREAAQNFYSTTEAIQARDILLSASY